MMPNNSFKREVAKSANTLSILGARTNPLEISIKLFKSSMAFHNTRIIQLPKPATWTRRVQVAILASVFLNLAYS